MSKSVFLDMSEKYWLKTSTVKHEHKVSVIQEDDIGY